MYAVVYTYEWHSTPQQVGLRIIYKDSTMIIYINITGISWVKRFFHVVRMLHTSQHNRLCHPTLANNVKHSNQTDSKLLINKGLRSRVHTIGLVLNAWFNNCVLHFLPTLRIQ